MTLPLSPGCRRDWNRIYGRRGFHQFQCVLPYGPGPAALRRLLESVAATGNASFLAVLKVMGRQGKGMLSFGMPGYSLALDFPAKPGSVALFAELERITRDARRTHLPGEGQPAPRPDSPPCIPKQRHSRAVRGRVDPHRRLDSDMARRLGL